MASGKLIMAAALVAASATANAQQPIDPSVGAPTATSATSAVVPKKTTQEKIAIAAGILGATFAALKSIKEAAQTSATPAAAAPLPNAPVK